MTTQRYVVAELAQGENGPYEARCWVAAAASRVEVLREVHWENPGHGPIKIVDPR